VYAVDQLNQRVEKFSNTGTYLTQWGHSGSEPGNFSSPIGIAVDGSGNVYVADTGNNRVEKFTSTGTYITQWTGSGPNLLNGPLGVAVDSGGNVYVADSQNDRVEKFTNTGTFLTQWGSGGSDDGEFGFPYGVAANSAGNVYVVDQGNSRVELFGDASSATISLVAGWNLISLPLVPVSTAIKTVLNDLIVAKNLTIVWSYQAGAWKSFTPTGTSTLTTMVDGLGYWIYVTRPSRIIVLGYVIPPAAAPPIYSLSAGWNLIGFKPQPDPTASENVTMYLRSLGTNYDNNNVWIYNNQFGNWTRASCDYSPAGLPTCDQNLAPGEGLWVYMTTAAKLTP
jgi:DNA-binding beta-propeller fold protein YncE